MIFFLILVVTMIAAFGAQQFIPPLPPFNERILLMQIIMFYGSVALPAWGMLALAFLGGLMWDLRTAQIVDDQLEVGIGWSVILYAVLCGLLSGFRPLFMRGRWELHCILTGICTAAIPFAEYLMLSIRRQPIVFVFNREIWWRIGGAGLAAMFIAPFIFFGMNYIAYLVRFNPQPDRRR